MKDASRQHTFIFVLFVDVGDVFLHTYRSKNITEDVISS